MLKEFIIVGAGSFIGGALRYAISLIWKWNGTGFPLATFIVNTVGCLLIGIFIGIFSRNPSSQLSLLLTAGFCGGFTTFSTFSKEGMQLIESGNIGMFIAYALASVALGLLAVFAGYYLTK